MIRTIIAALVLWSALSFGALAQGTQLTPPGFRWGSIGPTTPSPGQMIGYDSSTGLPCIVGQTATCSLQTSSGGGSVTAVPATGTGGESAVTVTSSSAQILAARTAPQRSLMIRNESTTASIAICRAPCTAALNTAGSITLLPGQFYSSSPSYVPLDAINAISSAASSPATIQAN